MLNKYFIEETIIEQLQRGFIIPIKVKDYNTQVFIGYKKGETWYMKDTKTGETISETEPDKYFLYDNVTGETTTCKENIIENFMNGTYTLGYSIVKDKMGTPIKKGDTILIDNKYIAKVNKIIIEPMELLKEHGYSDFVSYIKYENILKPIIKCTVFKQEHENPYTHNLEFKEFAKFKQELTGSSHVIKLNII